MEHSHDIRLGGCYRKEETFLDATMPEDDVRIIKEATKAEDIDNGDMYQWLCYFSSSYEKGTR